MLKIQSVQRILYFFARMADQEQLLEYDPDLDDQKIYEKALCLYNSMTPMERLEFTKTWNSTYDFHISIAYTVEENESKITPFEPKFLKKRSINRNDGCMFGLTLFIARVYERH